MTATLVAALMDVLVTHTRFLDQYLADAGRAWAPRCGRTGARPVSSFVRTGSRRCGGFGFGDVQPTVWIVEQLLVGFLPPAVQNRVLDDVTALGSAGSRFAADHLPGEYRHVPEHPAANGWHTVERDVTGLFRAVGLAGRWRGDDRDAATNPRYVTATRV